MIRLRPGGKIVFWFLNRVQRIKTWFDVRRLACNLEMQLTASYQVNHKLRQDIQTVKTENKRLTDRLSDEDYCRSQLMQLRIVQGPENGRLGWMVSAFIPEDAIQSLMRRDETAQKKFTSVVAEALVFNALNGIFRRSAQGKFTALVFEPPRANAGKAVVTGWREGDYAPRVRYEQEPVDLKKLPERRQKELSLDSLNVSVKLPLNE